MSITFDKMKEEHKVLYSNMWGGTEFCSDDFITNKNWTGSKSKDSFFVKTPETTKVFEKIIPSLAKDLANAFELQNKNRFTEKLRQACGGSGKEAMKIATMHSSSLCSLLFFYNLSDECDKNKLVLELGNKENTKRYSFYESLFEFQNVVISRGAPSNMDVVLLGYEIYNGKVDNSKPVVLFLESKFSEYYIGVAKHLDISKAYLKNEYGEKVYNKLLGVKVGDDESVCKYSKKEDKDSEKQFRLSVRQEEYLDGIKQMISHYIGVRNLLSREVVEKRACEAHKVVVDKIIKDKAEVLLGSIIFDNLFEEVEDNKKYYGAYEGAHIELAKILNEVSNGVKGVAGTDRLTVLEEPLTYTKLLEEMKKQNFQLDKKVEDYYFRKAKTTDSGTADC